MMRTMRENTKWIMLVTALAFVALMLFEWGMDLTGRSGAQFAGGEVGRVNGEPVSYEEFNAVYRNLYDREASLVDGPVGTALNRQIEDAAWDQAVLQRLISQELRRRGIIVTASEIRQAARYEPPPEFRSNPMFLSDGQFDLAKYHGYMSSPAIDTQLLLQLEAYYRDAIPRTKLFLQQTAGVYVTDDHLWQFWRDGRDAVTVRFLVFDPQALVPDDAVSIGDAAIQQYYRRNQGDFLRPERVTVKYVSLDRRPNAADTAAALARANAVRAELESGTDFAVVAERESADSVSASEGGKLTVRRGQAVPAFDQAAFALPIGRVSEPVQSQFGFHVIRVDARRGDEAEVRHVLIPIELTFERENELLDRADSLDVLTENLPLDRIAAEMGLQVRESEMIPGLEFLTGIGEAADGADWAFRTAQPGQVSEVFESPTAYYTMELVKREPERTLTVAEATETIRTALMVQNKIDRTKQIARDALDRIRAGASLEQVAESLNLEVREAGPFTRGDFVPGLGRLNAATGTAFGLRPGQISGVVEADRTVFIIQTVSRTDADRAEWEQQKDEQRQRVLQAMAQQRWEQYLDALRRNARIVDNREELLRGPVTATN